METICNTAQCTGCGACYSSCPHQAIRMNVSNDGFLRPVINNENCANCGLCIATCPVNHPADKIEPLAAYMAWTKDEKMRSGSSSGGVFPAIASFILQRGGVVFGAAYDDSMNVCHKCIENVNQLPQLQSSKYVQSDINETFKQAKVFLAEGREVYFVGTPCQIAGLRKYLRKDYPNLLISDFVCHGCPSNDLFQKQIRSFENQFHDKVIGFNFRSKKRFGQGYDCYLTLRSKGHKSLNAELVPYFYGFWRNISLRDCCYQCQYAISGRVSDITLGDFWTVKKYHKGIRTSKGISLCLTNTPRGDRVLKSIPNLVLADESIEIAVKSQGHLRHSVKMPPKHRSFVNSYSELSWDDFCRDYLNPPSSYRLKMKIRNIFKLITLYKLWK